MSKYVLESSTTARSTEGGSEAIKSGCRQYARWVSAALEGVQQT